VQPTKNGGSRRRAWLESSKEKNLSNNRNVRIKVDERQLDQFSQGILTQYFARPVSIQRKTEFQISKVKI
jgi:hypothetical protein